MKVIHWQREQRRKLLNMDVKHFLNIKKKKKDDKGNALYVLVSCTNRLLLDHKEVATHWKRKMTPTEKPQEH